LRPKACRGPRGQARALAMMRDNNTGDWRKGKR
jgi:hypothetical protein